VKSSVDDGMAAIQFFLKNTGLDGEEFDEQQSPGWQRGSADAQE